MHSEFNHAQDQTTHFLQIWIQPNVTNIPPSYEQKTVPTTSKEGNLKLIASPDGAGEAVLIHADAKLYAGLFDGDQQTLLALDPNRKAYVHLIKGDLVVNGEKLTTGDAVLMDKEQQIHITDGRKAEVLVFDLAP
jgi:redox-sensitive bicupin YhaK (pirin superfamily)